MLEATLLPCPKIEAKGRPWVLPQLPQNSADAEGGRGRGEDAIEAGVVPLTLGHDPGDGGDIGSVERFTVGGRKREAPGGAE